MERTEIAETDESAASQLDAAYDSRPPFDARLGARTKLTTKRIAQRLLWLVMAIIGYLTHTKAPSEDAAPIRRILVVRVDLLGDVVLSLPAVRALKRAYPDAEIDMLVLKSTAGILQGERDISRVLAYDPHIWRQPKTYLNPANWRAAGDVLRTMRAARYDLAISISGDMGSILTRLSNARRRIGYAKEAYPFFMTHTLPGGRYRTHQHETCYVLALAEAAGGIVEPDDALLRLSIVPAAAQKMAATLQQARSMLQHGGPVITMHGGARNGQAKRWPTGHFARLAERLIEELDALVVLTGAPSEAPLAQSIEQQCRYPLLNLLGKTSLPELTALLAASDLVISGDSGPMHIACAVRTPVVALHGPTDPALSGPTAPDAIILRRDIWCSPCYDASATAECPFGNPVCMKGLSPELVFAAARRQLKRASENGRASLSLPVIGAIHHATTPTSPHS
jgi:lipopolysaccharide heptosyltransferase II